MSEANKRRLGRRDSGGFNFLFEDRPITAWPGETVAGALLAAGERWLRTAEDGGHRGLVCGIGVCWECRCIVDGRPHTRGGMLEAAPGMRVYRQQGVAR